MSAIKLTRRSIESAAILGAKSIVVHSLTPAVGESVLETNLKLYRSLDPYAAASGSKIALENLFGEPYDSEQKRWLGKRFATHETMLELVHTIPFTGKVNRKEVAASLAEIGYRGELTLEIFSFINAFPAELVPDVLKLAASTGRHIASMIENSRNTASIIGSGEN